MFYKKIAITTFCFLVIIVLSISCLDLKAYNGDVIIAGNGDMKLNEKVYYLGKPLISQFFANNKTSDSVKLIYREFDNYCLGCRMTIFDTFKKKVTDWGKKNILIITSIENTRENRIMLNAKFEDFEHINIVPNQLIFRLKDSINNNNIFFAIVHKSGLVNKIFYPNRAKPELTNQYLNIIKATYFKNNISVRK